MYLARLQYLCIVIFFFSVTCHTEVERDTYPEGNRDGNIPFVNVEMQPSQRWKAARTGLEEIKRELSYVIDKELEREKARLMSKLDAPRGKSSQMSQMQLLQYNKKHGGNTLKAR